MRIKHRSWPDKIRQSFHRFGGYRTAILILLIGLIALNIIEAVEGGEDRPRHVLAATVLVFAVIWIWRQPYRPMIKSITLNTDAGSFEASWGMIREVTMRKGYNEDRIDLNTFQPLRTQIVELTIRLQIPVEDYGAVVQEFYQTAHEDILLNVPRLNP